MRSKDTMEVALVRETTPSRYVHGRVRTQQHLGPEHLLLELKGVRRQTVLFAELTEKMEFAQVGDCRQFGQGHVSKDVVP